MCRSVAHPKYIDFIQSDDDGRFGYGNGERIQLIVRLVKEAGFHLLESPLSADQQVVDMAILEWWRRGLGMR